MRPSKEFKLIIRRMFLGVVAVGGFIAVLAVALNYFQGTLWF